jgi:ribosome-associated protein
MPRRSPTTDIAAAVQRAAAVCVDSKANDVLVLNLKPLTDMTDYFVIASGTSDTHVRGLAEQVVAELKKEGISVYHVEGLAQGRWVLLDYVDFVVHIFHPALRAFYQLERLWGVAEVLPVGAAVVG